MFQGSTLRRAAAWLKKGHFEVGIFAAALACFVWLVPFGDLDTIIGDNIAQVAYWRVLFHRNLVGSIGSSAMKPGLIVLLGVANDASLWLFGSTILIKLVFALAGAGLVTIVAKIARDAANPTAGIGAAVYLMLATPVPSMFSEGTSMIAFAPLLFWGIWSFARDRERAGALILCLAATVRIEALLVLFWLAVSQQLLRRNWRGLIFTGALTIATCSLTAFVYYRVQGSVARFNIGPSVGYVFEHGLGLRERVLSSLAYLANSSYQILFEDCGFPYLAVAALLELARNPRRRCYASLLAIALFLTAYAASGQGGSGARYFQFLVPFVAAFGAAGLARPLPLAELRNARFAALLGGFFLCLGVIAYFFGARNVLISVALVCAATALSEFHRRFLANLAAIWKNLAWGAFFIACSVHAVRAGVFHSVGEPASYMADAKRLVETAPIPPGKRVLTEDDLIYSVLVRDVKFFRHATALQYFNIQDDDARAKTLTATDYILVSKGRHHFYYLNYDPLERGRQDPFRRAISRVRQRRSSRRKGGAFKMYGSLITLMENSPRWLLFKVEPQAR